MIDGETLDSLTGLPSRESMMQAVAQAEFDRDRFAVAVLDVRRFADFNRRYGMVVGDELLCMIGRVLVLHTATGTEACRLGGDRFAIIALEPDCSTRWVAPIVTAIRTAIEHWVENRQAGSTIVAPEIVVGVAEGLTAEVWTNAETALQTAKDYGAPVVDYRSVDATTRRRLRSCSAPARGDSARPGTDRALVQRRIEPVGRPQPSWLWVRLSAGLSPEDGRPECDELAVADRESQLVEHWLVEQACRRLATAERQMRISVPVATEAVRARSLAQHLFPLIEQHRVPPSRLLFEIDYDTIAVDERGPFRRLGDPGTRFVHEIAGLGSSVVVTGFTGGWRAWTCLRRLEVRFLRPAVDLMQAAGQGDSIALRSLSTVAAQADDLGLELIAPWIGPGVARDLPLAEFGFAYREHPLASSQEVRPTAFGEAKLA